MGDVEYGRCDVCKADRPLTRTYFYFPIACECCGPTHFIMKRHCHTCTPDMPLIIDVRISAKRALDPIHEGLFKMVRE